MIRAEIIANQSVQEDIIDALETNIPGVLYTIIPLVHGRGKTSYKLGTSSWPETNFVLFTYVKKEDALKIKQIISAVKASFRDEGIKLFFTDSQEL